MAQVSFRIPQECHDRLHDLAKRSSKTHVLTHIIEKYKDTTFSPAEALKSSGFVLHDDTVATLDQIVDKNSLKSRNQAIALLIDRAWQDHQTQQTP